MLGQYEHCGMQTGSSVILRDQMNFFRHARKKTNGLQNKNYIVGGYLEECTSGYV
jgi:hypothetical protein